MTKVHAYLARIKDQEKEVIAVPDGAGRALCVSSDKHWTLAREWDELHIIAPLVEAARWEQNYLDADTVAHHATVEAAEREDAALADRLERQAATISELQGSFLRVERDRDRWRARATVAAEARTAPVEEKARELYRAATPDARWETVADEYRRIAAHVLWQEDPIMVRTRELLDLAYPGDYASTGAFETCRKIAEAEARLEDKR